jgi:hypothetical protein
VSPHLFFAETERDVSFRRGSKGSFTPGLNGTFAAFRSFLSFVALPR